MANETTVFPIFIDSRPEYLAGCRGASLLQLPLSNGTVLTHIAERLQESIPHGPRVVRTFEADPAYDEALKATGLISKASVSSAEFWSCLVDYEPSDWLLFVDPRCFPVDGTDPWPLLQDLDESPRLARHVIAMAPTSAGTSERVAFDAADRVRCVQRYYEAVTWSVACGVVYSIVPVSALLMAAGLPFESLVELRKGLAGTGLPSRDIPIAGAVVDLGLEQSLLALNERGLGTKRHAGAASSSGVAHPSARLIGRVILHEGSQVAEGATVIGPAVIGAHARVGRGAVIAQCVVARDVSVADGVVARHRVITVSRPDASAPLLPSAPEVGDGPLALGNEIPVHRVYPMLKRAAELAVSVTTLMILSPLLASIAVLVKLDSEGPIVYGDPREAQGGRLFHCYKFRTMRVRAHAAQRALEAANQVDGPQFKMRVDPRVTRVGKWLRRTNLDELPQLFNVAIGHMSLVGPRPSPFRENQTCVPWRDARLSVRPGITGLWQVCRHDRESGDFHQWIYYDIEYIRNQSFLVDLKILIATLWTGGGRTHVPLSWIISSGPNEYV